MGACLNIEKVEAQGGCGLCDDLVRAWKLTPEWPAIKSVPLGPRSARKADLPTSGVDRKNLAEECPLGGAQWATAWAKVRKFVQGLARLQEKRASRTRFEELRRMDSSRRKRDARERYTASRPEGNCSGWSSRGGRQEYPRSGDPRNTTPTPSPVRRDAASASRRALACGPQCPPSQPRPQL